MGLEIVSVPHIENSFNCVYIHAYTVTILNHTCKFVWLVFLSFLFMLGYIILSLCSLQVQYFH